jgi:hypothetical protein
MEQNKDGITVSDDELKMYETGIPLRDYLLIEPDLDADSITLESGVSFYIDNSYEKDKYRSVRGTVKTWGNNCVGFEVGDIVYFGYLTLQNAREQVPHCGIQIFNHEREKTVALIPQDVVVLIVRNGEYVSTENYTIAKSSVEEAKTMSDSGLLYLPEQAISVSDTDFVVVSSNVVDSGTKIITDKFCDIGLEYGLTAKLKDKLFRIMNDNVLATY